MQSLRYHMGHLKTLINPPKSQKKLAPNIATCGVRAGWHLAVRNRGALLLENHAEMRAETSVVEAALEVLSVCRMSVDDEGVGDEGCFATCWIFESFFTENRPNRPKLRRAQSGAKMAGGPG